MPFIYQTVLHEYDKITNEASDSIETKIKQISDFQDKIYHSFLDFLKNQVSNSRDKEFEFLFSECLKRQNIKNRQRNL